MREFPRRRRLSRASGARPLPRGIGEQGNSQRKDKSERGFMCLAE